MSVSSRILPLVLALPLVVGVPTSAAGQQPTTFVEPAEYGHDERHDPLDYAEPTDLMTDRDVNVGVRYDVQQYPDRSRFHATGNSGGSWYVSPVWMTFPHHIRTDASGDQLPDADGGALHDQHDGLARPVDADTYTHLSMRFHVAVDDGGTDPGALYVSWFTCQEWLPPCQGIMKVAVKPGWNTVSVPIQNNVPDSGLSREWRGTVHGLRLQGALRDDPITVTMDWFRLFDGGSQYEVTMPADRNSYLYSNQPTLGADGRASADEVWGRLRPSDYTSPFRVNVGGLPPGRWYLFDESGVPMGSTIIERRPRPEVLDPDMAGGVDYATEVLQNPWDFEDRGDFVRVGNAEGVELRNSELSAVNTTNDPYVELPLGTDGLDPVHYHRVTIDQHYDSTFNLDDGAKATNPIPGGSHGRLLWRTKQHPQDWRECAHVSDGREFVFYKTWDTYTYDMKNVPAAQGMTSSAEPNIGVSYCTVTGPDPHWTQNGAITYLRLDPHEAPSKYRWYVDDLRIAADDAADPTFDVTWTEHNWAPNFQPHVTVRLDTNRSGHDGEVLYDGPQTKATQSVTFDATDRLPGTYWVSITSTVNGRTSRDYATGPLQVSPRISGPDRIATAVEVSRQTFDGARTAVLASSETFPDALVSVQLADVVEGPVLLTGSARLDGRVTRELERLGVQEVVVAGGTTALSPRVQRGLENAGFRVTRIGGETRYDTAAAIAREALERRGTTGAARVLVTTGENFPDALAAGPFVGHGDLPLVLAKPEQTPPPGPDGSTPPPFVPAENDAARDFVADVGARAVTVLGGPDALTDPVIDRVRDGRRADRIAGQTRFDTARKLAAAAVDAGANAGDVLVATGRNFPDALSAGPAALARGGVLALTEKDAVPAATRAQLDGVTSWSSWRVVGGPVAVSHATVRALRDRSDL